MIIFQLLEKLQNTENPEDQIKIADEILEIEMLEVLIVE